ncbi:galactofuranosylgalactofuranosylrhamnosyl-N-acetylglucosaminyl-diphospho-decaprenol beta-1,5/1,6-galactofuranosyltransferase [Microbacterium terrae]|uniref:Galactofuranosyl transferase GlfT2 n=1 Tax=Microbacterium terrae TaxID=69369 RepID=A0A0M2H5X1_9MICO|nr:glycosyltransferase [Microbacterium terrae]KJL41736.1 Galactofuranosyl transferase GlfT2 [Microbacterium terrae]MBP1077973.1 galactofuranosylgalactofuranosylrhamnosyl-N-acetylglucosaminyl-diphospho-decaprenol beta-1,5/1,6-galactofuranosyltransferase [Microbacterium terrae]GLK00144.1 glycosyl transferase [Microbacterium terrae]
MTQPTASHTLARVVLPAADDSAVRGLYLSGDAEIAGRRAARVRPGGVASFATYFNAFPAAYWRRFTDVREVVLEMRIEGSARVSVRRSDAAATVRTVAEIDVTDAALAQPVDLGESTDGGWIWFEVSAAPAGATVRDAAWSTAAAPRRAARATIGITTMDKPDYCVATLTALAAEEELRPHLERVFVIDQGTRLVADETGFDAAADGLGDLLAIVRQPNLGGSGGYARAMAETLTTDATFVQFMDDDVRVEPEAVRRAIVFGAYCTEPTIVGGHMLDLNDPAKLYAWAEVVDEEPFMWRPRHDDEMPIDLAATTLEHIPLVHQRMDADYNGWWMCLIPRAAIERVGLALPVFLKWDDAEYSLRAGAAGIPTVSLPGVALWHVSWVSKDDQIDWQAYFHARNRLVTALLHSTRPNGGHVLTHSRRVDLKHLFAMQYYPVTLRHRALRAVLSGPEHLHPDLRTALPAARTLAAEFPETAPAAAGITAARPIERTEIPTGMRLRLFMVERIAALWVRKPRGGAHAEVEAAAGEARWWRLARHDSALVRMASSGAPHLYVRRRDAYRRLLRESLRLHRELDARWDELARAYRAADLTSLETWRSTFDGPASQGDARRLS